MMMHAYGSCPGCGGEGALWIVRHILTRRFWLFGKVTMKPVYRCDECDVPVGIAKTGEAG